MKRAFVSGESVLTGIGRMPLWLKWEVRNIGLYGFQEKGKSQDCGACKSH